jgi:hypothetical protein
VDAIASDPESRARGIETGFHLLFNIIQTDTETGSMGEYDPTEQMRISETYEFHDVWYDRPLQVPKLARCWPKMS